jgi:3D (Asp-Asp-Asp) domain-containing protein
MGMTGKSAISTVILLVVGALLGPLTEKGNTQEENPSVAILTRAESLRLQLLSNRKALWEKATPKVVAKATTKSPKAPLSVVKATPPAVLSPTGTNGVRGNIPKQRILARVTTYWADGPGTDYWSARNQSSTSTKLVCKHHAAVDPKLIPYGSGLIVQYGKKRILVEAVDTGGDVKNRKAARRLGRTAKEVNAPVVDLFFQSREEALTYARTNPPFQWVDIIPPWQMDRIQNAQGNSPRQTADNSRVRLPKESS